MKYLILLFPLTALAMMNWVPENKGNTVWTTQARCEQVSGQECFSFKAGVDDVRKMKVKQVDVDDPEKPIYAAKTNLTDCVLSDEDNLLANNCRVITARENIGTEENPNYVYTLCTDPTYYAVYAKKQDFKSIPGKGYFAYCTKLLGYEQKKVKKLVEDQTLIDEVAEQERLKQIESKLQGLMTKHKEKLVDLAAWQEVKIKEDLTKEEKDLVQKKIDEITEK